MKSRKLGERYVQRIYARDGYCGDFSSRVRMARAYDAGRRAGLRAGLRAKGRTLKGAITTTTALSVGCSGLNTGLRALNQHSATTGKAIPRTSTRYATGAGLCRRRPGTPARLPRKRATPARVLAFCGDRRKWK